MKYLAPKDGNTCCASHASHRLDRGTGEPCEIKSKKLGFLKNICHLSLKYSILIDKENVNVVIDNFI